MKYLLTNLSLILFALHSVSAQETNKAVTPKIKNNIKITATNGVVVNYAGLYFEDYTTPVPENNTVALKQHVYLILELKPNSWIQRDSIVSIGASEKILTNTGALVLQETDLFSKLTNIKATDAEYITLKAVITANDRNFPYFLVHFSVWDKWGKGKITGSYKLNMTKPKD
jgi:hypothetical protein